MSSSNNYRSDELPNHTSLDHSRVESKWTWVWWSNLIPLSSATCQVQTIIGLTSYRTQQSLINHMLSPSNHSPASCQTNALGFRYVSNLSNHEFNELSDPTSLGHPCAELKYASMARCRPNILGFARCWVQEDISRWAAKPIAPGLGCALSLISLEFVIDSCWGHKVMFIYF